LITIFFAIYRGRGAVGAEIEAKSIDERLIGTEALRFEKKRLEEFHLTGTHPNSGKSTMKKLIVFLICISGFAFAGESTPNSPDGRFRIKFPPEDLGSMTIFDTTAKEVVFTDQDEDLSAGRAVNALWSPDSKMVAITFRYKHGQEDYAVLRWNGKTFKILDLPPDTIPLSWTADNRLICSIRVQATYYFDPKANTLNPVNGRK